MTLHCVLLNDDKIFLPQFLDTGEELVDFVYLVQALHQPRYNVCKSVCGAVLLYGECGHSSGIGVFGKNCLKSRPQLYAEWVIVLVALRQVLIEQGAKLDGKDVLAEKVVYKVEQRLKLFGLRDDTIVICIHQLLEIPSSVNAEYQFPVVVQQCIEIC